MEKEKYFLILEYRPGDFMPIDINIITHNMFPIDYTNIKNIDVFTEKYNIEEILDMIEKTNILPEKYLSGKMSIINSKKFHYDVIFKEDIYSFPDFLFENLNNKQVMNKLMNVYLKYNKDGFANMKKAIDNKDTNMIMLLISDLDYINTRSIYTYIKKNINVKNKEKILENLNNAA